MGKVSLGKMIYVGIGNVHIHMLLLTPVKMLMGCMLCEMGESNDVFLMFCFRFRMHHLSTSQVSLIGAPYINHLAHFLNQFR